MKLDETRLRTTLHALHTQLTVAEASAIVDIARFAASADGRMDLGEMSTIARLSNILYGMAGQPDHSVPSKPLDGNWLAELPTKLVGSGVRELAYACAMLIVQTDLNVTKEEDALGRRLAAALQIADERARELSAQMDAMVRGA